MKLLSREDFHRSRKAWEEFGSEWAEVRRLSSSWTAFPPAGSIHDDRDATNPSPRAIVYRALSDNPAELRRILLRCKSWNGVIASIIGLEARLREDIVWSEKDAEFDKDQPNHRESAMALGRILDRLDASRTGA
jgi:hypothetical protein